MRNRLRVRSRSNELASLQGHHVYMFLHTDQTTVYTNWVLNVTYYSHLANIVSWYLRCLLTHIVGLNFQGVLNS